MTRGVVEEWPEQTRERLVRRIRDADVLDAVRHHRNCAHIRRIILHHECLGERTRGHEERGLVDVLSVENRREASKTLRRVGDNRAVPDLEHQQPGTTDGNYY